ncbi:MAG TPA: hypothetical protein PK957_01715 [Candidatus Dojkabacteria bacterium]|nr:hypothetical protein [Candidatus Dojkabacteria bacterium]HQF36056.1 hypothetical protein [Candidatus Dojkabacteria bacterium]
MEHLKLIRRDRNPTLSGADIINIIDATPERGLYRVIDLFTYFCNTFPEDPTVQQILAKLVSKESQEESMLNSINGKYGGFEIHDKNFVAVQKSIFEKLWKTVKYKAYFKNGRYVEQYSKKAMKESS